tara:strand:- start:1297 stop:1677 length:381 start_codon:yes stop_codon:yes gene_type:complete
MIALLLGSVALSLHCRASIDLAIAARNGDLARVTSLVNEYENIDIEPAFLMSASYCRILVMRYLIESGARDFDGALAAAAFRNQMQALRLLVECDNSLKLSTAMRVASISGSTEAEYFLLTKIKGF